MKKHISLFLISILMMCFSLSACTSETANDIISETGLVGNQIQESDTTTEQSINTETSDNTQQEKIETPTNETIENNTVSNVVHKGTLKVHFIDVGQGDSIFAELPNGETLLVDAGPSNDTTTRYISNLGYNSITYVVATHPDADHITGMPNVLNSFSIKKFYMPEKEHTTKIFEKMIDAVANNGCEAIYATAGKSIVDVSPLSVKFLAPSQSYGDNNNISAVIKITYNDIAFMLTGDAESVSENAMINAGYDLSSDIIKVGHHGSKSSTSSAFLKAVNPKAAIISVGKENRYSHPSNETIALLNNYGIDIYRTDEVGTIIVSTDGQTYTIDKAKSVAQPNAPPVVSKTQIVEESTSVNNETVIESNSTVVYKTKTGSKYHRDGCSYLKSRIETTVSEAKQNGLTPCSRCNPPQ